MDIGTFHGLWTLTLFISFLGVVWWAFGKNRKSRFEEDANLVFADEKPACAKSEQGVTSK